MNKDHIIAASREVSIKNNRADNVSVRMGEPFRALGPPPGHSWQPKHGASLSHSQGIRPHALHFYRNERGLTGQFESNADHVLNMLRREGQLSLGFVQLRCQLLHLLPQLAFELQDAADRLGLLLSAGGIELSALPQHGLFHLPRNHRPNFAEILADGFNLKRSAHQELQVGLKIAYLARHLCRTEALANEMEDLDLLGFLAVAVNATVALFHSIGVPRDLKVN